MSMTREEAVELLCYGDWLNVISEHIGKTDTEKIAEAMSIVGKTLRPVSREQVEKVFHGCPECKPRCGLCIHMGAWDKYGKPYVCEQCVDCSNFKSDQRFCEVCGAPMTDEAVQMVMERWKEAVVDEA